MMPRCHKKGRHKKGRHKKRSPRGHSATEAVSMKKAMGSQGELVSVDPVRGGQGMDNISRTGPLLEGRSYNHTLVAQNELCQ
jgi:hypothetical protein